VLLINFSCYQTYRVINSQVKTSDIEFQFEIIFITEADRLTLFYPQKNQALYN
jgi:hypothetical protein